MKDYYIITESDGLTKTEVKKIVRQEVRKEVEKEFKKLDDLSEKDVEKMIKKQIKDETFTEKDIKNIVADMMVNQFKFFWEKRSFWSKNI